MNINTLLSRLESFEIIMAEAYGQFSELPGLEPEGAELFRWLRRDEYNHASQIQLVQRVIANNPQLQQAVTIPAGQLEAAIAAVGNRIAKRKDNRLPELLAVALYAEEHAEEEHGKKVLQNLLPELKALLEGLIRSDRSHSGTIRLFAGEHGIRLPGVDRT